MVRRLKCETDRRNIPVIAFGKPINEPLPFLFKKTPRVWMFAPSFSSGENAFKEGTIDNGKFVPSSLALFCKASIKTVPKSKLFLLYFFCDFCSRRMKCGSFISAICTFIIFTGIIWFFWKINITFCWHHCNTRLQQRIKIDIFAPFTRSMAGFTKTRQNEMKYKEFVLKYSWVYFLFTGT